MPGLGEAQCLWAVYAVEAAAVTTTAARLAGSSGQGRGAGPAVDLRLATVFLRHPLAPAAVPLGALALARIGRRQAPGALGRAVAAGIVVGGLAFMGRTEAAASAAAAIVTVGVVLTVEATARKGIGGVASRRPGDGLRTALGLGLLAAALPWVLADLGVYVGDVPLLGAVFLSRQRLPPGAAGPAVHLGHHHGMDGALLAWTGLALSRQLAAIANERLRAFHSATLAGMTVYGMARAVEDGWYEQMVKRGRTTQRLPILVRSGRPVGWRAWTGVLGATWLGDRCLRWEVAAAAVPPSPVPILSGAPRRSAAARPASG